MHVYLKQVGNLAELTIRSSASADDPAPFLVFSETYPENLDAIARTVQILGGTFLYAEDPKYPAACLTIPVV